MEDLLKQMILAFVTAGGCGYVNYFILENLNLININENDSSGKVFALGLFSLLNLALCFLLTDVLEWSIALSVAVTIALTLFLSFTLFPWLINKYTDYISEKRKESFGGGTFSPKSVKTILFDRDEVLFVYVYDLRTNDLLILRMYGMGESKK